MGIHALYPFSNAWITVETADHVDRIDPLRNVPAAVRFFFKQWGGVQKKKAGRLLEKKTWDQMPA